MSQNKQPIKLREIEMPFPRRETLFAKLFPTLRFFKRTIATRFKIYRFSYSQSCSHLIRSIVFKRPMTPHLHRIYLQLKFCFLTPNFNSQDRTLVVTTDLSKVKKGIWGTEVGEKGGLGDSLNL